MFSDVDPLGQTDECPMSGQLSHVNLKVMIENLVIPVMM